MAYAHITDHYERALARLPTVYKDKPRYLAWLAAYCAKVQEIEDVLWDIYNDRMIQNSPTGDLLAKLAAIVAQPSWGLSDAQWLLMVKARILSLRSRGRRRDLIAVTQALWNQAAAPEVWVFDFFPASVMVVPQVAADLSPYVAADSFVGPAVAAGVRLSYVWSPETPSNTLIFGSVHASGFNATPPNTTPDLVAGNYIGSIYASGFAAGPPPTATGGGVLAGVIAE